MDKLKKQRSAIKGKITRVKNFLDQCAINMTATVEELNCKLELLSSAWDEYQDTHRKIVDIVPDAQFDAEDEYYVDNESKYASTKVGIVILIRAIESNSSSTIISVPGGIPIVPSGSSTVVDVRLPRMDLLIFSGNQLEWQSFRDLFRSIVHTNSKISDSQLHYLKNSLRDEAQSLLQSIDITHSNYTVAWDLLEERFENARRVIQCHMKNLFSQQAMSTESASQLRRLLDTTSKHVRALKTFGLETDHWDSWQQWELCSPGRTQPQLVELKTFLEQRCRALEATSFSRPRLFQKQPNLVHSNQKQIIKAHLTTKTTCPVCKSPLYSYHCTEFLRLPTKEKSDLVKKLHLCFNCLRTNHSSKECKPESNCRQCNSRHHTLLHSPTVPQSQVKSNFDSHVVSGLATHIGNANSGLQVLLSTVLIKVENSSGQMQTCRALLDSGSQASLITEACVQRLGLQRSRLHIGITGIGSSGTENTRGMVNRKLHSNVSSFSIELNAVILTKVTGNLPSAFINNKDWMYLKNIELADSNFNKPGTIDILIGADAYEDIITDGKIQGPQGCPSARNTRFGWILSGKVHATPNNTTYTNVGIVNISDQLKLFWELEEVEPQHYLTSEEKECEAHFNNTHVKDISGRFIVSLPFKEESKSLGLSKEMCLRRLRCVEKRLDRYPQYKTQYHAFMEQYLNLGHMESIPLQEQPEIVTKTNYLPHYFVLKESSSITSFRVVFDASAKTSTGVSFNDKMLVGPRLQEDMYNILLRFRFYKYAFTADIAKMYRQIKATTSDIDLQRILWRTDSSLPVQEYRLQTVTYGTASAPYLATKVLQQLVADDGHRFPLAKKAALTDFYVDDIMSGTNSLENALILQRALIDMLQLGGFQLRKWSSNHAALLESLPIEYRETNLPLSITSDDSIKALGLHWSPAGDFFSFKVNLSPDISNVTKRSILSETAKLFDPLGWLAPVIIIAKILLQQLWIIGAYWDNRLPEYVESSWKQFRSQLFTLEELCIKRIVSNEDDTTHQLHGFCDASEKAYAAVVYLRSRRFDGSISTHLLSSKTKVAPVKQVSLPRLELCGANLLARLLTKVKSTLRIHVVFVQCWTDSMITLAWISRYPNRWTTFVANKVAEIQTLTPPSCWRYVPSSDNPADCASRGSLPELLIKFPLCWTGPQWLSFDSSVWPSTRISNSEQCLIEHKKSKVHMVQINTEWDLISKYSSWTKLMRVTAYCIRFARNCRSSIIERTKSHLTIVELHQAHDFLIINTQQQEFSETISAIINKKFIPPQMASINPFIDKCGVLRVDGRLRHSKLNFDRKHPILLPKNHHITRLIVLEEDVKQLHAGPQLLLASLQQKYWIVNARNIIRQITHRCVKCIRDRAKTIEQQMGDLPSYRIEPTRPFLKTGVNYAGPFHIKSIKGRGGKIIKAYVSLFICSSIKAIHLELVTDLTSEAFLASLRRFMARRGKPSDVFSDNGTNFVGANTDLKKLVQLVGSQSFNSSLAKKMSNEGVAWHFIPPRAPHFGGLWEAAVKSTKMHLRRVTKP